MNRITPIRTNMSVCFFTEPFPLSPTGDVRRPRHASLVAGSDGMYDENRSRYIGPFDHSLMKRPRSGTQMVLMSYVPAVRHSPESWREVSQRPSTPLQFKPM